jgi:ppGpp synthetase/RelA/SpoT-type nucleotidyltranferase
MQSYIQLFNLTPPANPKPLDELKSEIDNQIQIQDVHLAIDMDIDTFRDKIIDALEIYYQLIGNNNSGLLPRFVSALIGYMNGLYYQVPQNTQMHILALSGVTTIKIRYKYIDSVIKKLIKLAKRDISILDNPQDIFFKGGALHDLIGMQFVCSSPYEREWVARACYNFFYFDNRTDDHLVYGFYTLKRESGYKGLHRDHSVFEPRFDSRFADVKRGDYDTFDSSMSDLEVLQNYAHLFNIELQIHTAFESLWSSMEHKYSYNIQAKGLGRDEKIRAQWHLLSDSLSNLEMQFERLQIETEEAQYTKDYINGYKFAKDLLSSIDTKAYKLYKEHIDTNKKLDELLRKHEISRQEYAIKCYQLVQDINQHSNSYDDATITILFRLQSAYINYSLANKQEYFNTYDISVFVKTTLSYYLKLHADLSKCQDVKHKKLLQIAINIRYLQLSQKYGLGLIHTDDSMIDEDEKCMLDYDTNLKLFVEVIEILNSLDDDSLKAIKQDDIAFLKIIHRSDIFAREWEIFANKSQSQQQYISNQIAKFRDRYINQTLKEHFDNLIQDNKIRNIGYILQFYTTLIWHGIIQPKDALKHIIRYSAYSRINQSDLFFYELSAYKYLVVDNHQGYDEHRLNHLKDFHIKNMIRQLFHIHKEESIYKFLKAKYRFEHLCNVEFDLGHFSSIYSV